MDNLIKAFFAVLCFSIAGNVLAMDNQNRQDRKHGRDEQGEPIYYAIRTRPGFPHKDNSPARVNALINSAKHIVSAGADLPTLYADFNRVFAQEPEGQLVETESDEFAMVRQSATIKDVVTEDDLVAMEEGNLVGAETDDEDDLAAQVLGNMKNK